jgi:hypothetical protein
MVVAVDGASGLLSVQCMLLPLSEIKDGLSFNPPPPSNDSTINEENSISNKETARLHNELIGNKM